MALDENIELIGLPEEGDFKVVQLIFDGHPVMVCGERNRFHKDMLEEYLRSQGVEPEKIKIPFKMGMEKILTSPRGERYHVVGMGEAGIMQRSRFFQLPGGISVDYHLKPDEYFKERLKQQFAGWNF